MSKYGHLYSTRLWRDRRAHQLKRHPLCAKCLAQDPPRLTRATVADHVQRHNGDVLLFFKGALQSLCKRCHDSDKQSEERAPPACDRDGYPTDRRW